MNMVIQYLVICGVLWSMCTFADVLFHYTGHRRAMANIVMAILWPLTCFFSLLLVVSKLSLWIADKINKWVNA